MILKNPRRQQQAQYRFIAQCDEIHIYEAVMCCWLTIYHPVHKIWVSGQLNIPPFASPKCPDYHFIPLCLGYVILCVGEGRGVHRVLVGKPERKRPLGRPRRRWEDNIKMDLQEVGGGGDWMELAQDGDRWRALVNMIMNLRVP